MPRVPCEVTTTRVTLESGKIIDGVCVTCSRCEHEIEVAGTSDRSIKRGLATLREECPNGEENFYVDAAEADTAP